MKDRRQNRIPRRTHREVEPDEGDGFIVKLVGLLLLLFTAAVVAIVFY